MSQSSRVQDGGKSCCASNVQGAGSSRSMVRPFTRCNWVEVASAYVQRREPNDESKITAAIDRHDFDQCKPDVC